MLATWMLHASRSLQRRSNATARSSGGGQWACCGGAGAHWAVCIWGRPIGIFAGHKSIVALVRSGRGASGLLGIAGRLEMFLQRVVAPFNVEVRYVEGLKSTAAGALSRIAQDAVMGPKEKCISLPVTTRGRRRLQKVWTGRVQRGS